MIWKKNQTSKNLSVNQDLNLFIKQYYLIVWSVEKIQKVKTQNL